MPERIVAIDIDGTLGDHYKHLANFAELWLGREIKYDPAMGWPDGANKFQFNRALGIGKQTYRKIKLAYRQGGMKRSMPVYDGAAELTRAIRHTKTQVWICTSRPYMKLDAIDPDTRHWLRHNHVQYDHLLYGDFKYRDLARQAGNNDIIVVLDDLTEMIVQAQGYSLEALLIERPHNEHRQKIDNVESVWDLWEAQAKILEMIHASS